MSTNLDIDVSVKVKSSGRPRREGQYMRIGELSRATGASTRALRYYEEQGLIRSERLSNGYRDYGAESVETIEFIQDLLAAGLSSKILRDIMPCVTGGHGQGSCTDLVGQVRQVRDALLDQERRIRAQREKLEEYLSGERSPRGRIPAQS